MISTSGSDSSTVAPTAVTPKLPVTMDTKGRVRTSKEQRRAILAEFELSGVSLTQFARRTGLKYSTFAAWVQRYHRSKRRGSKPPVRLLEAVMAPPSPNSALLVELPGGARLQIRETSQVSLMAALLRALQKPC